MSGRSFFVANPVKNSGKAAVWLVIALFVLAAGWWGWQSFAGGDKQEAGAQPRGGIRGGFMMEAVPVSAHRLQPGQFIEQIKALGTVEAWSTAQVTSQVSGILQKLHFAEGQPVEEGALLAELDGRSYQAALLQAEGSLQETRAQLAQAELDLRRYQSLNKNESIARQTLEQQQAQVNQLRGSLKVRQAQRDAAQLNVDYSRITAPIGGRMGLRAVDVGNHVAAGSTVLVTITQQQPIAVSFTVPEQEVQPLLQASNGEAPLVVEAWSRDDRQLLATGVLDSMDNQVDTSTGTLRLKARFTNENNQLFPKQFVNVRLQLATHENVLKVPNDALQFGNQGRFVWVLDDEDKAQMQLVKPGQGDAEFTLVKGDLQDGQRVVVEGVDRLKNGSKVEVITLDGQPVEQPESAKPATGPAGGKGRPGS